MTRKRFPDACPVFEVVKIDQECRGRIVVGIDFYPLGIDVLTIAADDETARMFEWDCYHYDWLKPLTPAARAMLEIAKAGSK